MTPTKRGTLVHDEWTLGVSYVTSLFFIVFHRMVFERWGTPWGMRLLFVWLFAVILASALAVVRHAEALAERLGDPYGTLILTLSVTFIEVMSLSAVMLHGGNPTLVRDTLFAVVMVILNGMVGMSLLLGGWKYREQHYNLQGANTYLGLIIPLTVLSLILPNFTKTTPGPILSPAQATILGLMSVALYGAFLAIQTGRQRTDFISRSDWKAIGPAEEASASVVERTSIWRHALLLVAYMIPIVFLAEALARPLDYFIATLGAPPALGGVLIAVLVATPEAISAVRAAVHNHMQRSVNIFLGSVLSTIGLTIPIMLIIAPLTGHTLVLGLEHTDVVMLLLTLAVSMITFASGRTNILQGLVHLVLFVGYLLLILQG
jgi:Ca2+:H+ antiporter